MREKKLNDAAGADELQDTWHIKNKIFHNPLLAKLRDEVSYWVFE